MSARRPFDPDRSVQALGEIITRLEAATAGYGSLDRAIRDALDLPAVLVPPDGGDEAREYTTDFEAAYSLLPASVTNFHLFTFIGHGRDDVPGECWGCQVHDRAQLIGAERASRGVKRLRLPRMNQPLRIEVESAIAEQFCEFDATHVATAPLAVCVVALKVIIGRSSDDDLWSEHGAAT